MSPPFCVNLFGRLSPICVGKSNGQESCAVTTLSCETSDNMVSFRVLFVLAAVAVGLVHNKVDGVPPPNYEALRTVTLAPLPELPVVDPRDLLVVLPGLGGRHDNQKDVTKENIALLRKQLGSDFSCELFVWDADLQVSAEEVAPCQIQRTKLGLMEVVGSIPRSTVRKHKFVWLGLDDIIMNTDQPVNVVDMMEIANANDLDIVEPSTAGHSIWLDMQNDQRFKVGHYGTFAEENSQLLRAEAFECFQDFIEAYPGHIWGFDLGMQSYCQPKIGVLHSQVQNHHQAETGSRYSGSKANRLLHKMMESLEKEGYVEEKPVKVKRSMGLGRSSVLGPLSPVQARSGASSTKTEGEGKKLLFVVEPGAQDKAETMLKSLAKEDASCLILRPVGRAVEQSLDSRSTPSETNRCVEREGSSLWRLPSEQEEQEARFVVVVEEGTSVNVDVQKLVQVADEYALDVVAPSGEDGIAYDKPAGDGSMTMMDSAGFMVDRVDSPVKLIRIGSWNCLRGIDDEQLNPAGAEYMGFMQSVCRSRQAVVSARPGAFVSVRRPKVPDAFVSKIENLGYKHISKAKVWGPLIKRNRGHERP